MTSSTPVRLGLIGCGRIAQVAHLPAIEKTGQVELTMVCDGNEYTANAVARRYGVPAATTDSAEVFASPDVDAVLIAVPDRFHESLVSQALAAGKHVLIEKPLAATVEECERLVAAAAESGLVLQVGAMKRHDLGLRWAKDFVRDTMGQVRSFHAWYRIGDLRPGIEHSLFPLVHSDPNVVAKEAGFKADRQKYLLATHGSHVFDTVLNLLGDVTRVVAKHRGFGRDQMWSIVFEMANGSIGTIDLTVDVPGEPDEGIQVFGEHGWVRVDIPFPFYKKPSAVQAYHDGSVVSPSLTLGDAYELQVDDFAAAVRGEGETFPDATDGLTAVRLIAAVAEAVETDREVTL